ncbi:hypothetical protein AQUCO_06700056v1 [Aquilegia coerulea]|uniref:Uncharacterized protein n=1 Tax=Aquilegia coerulea TaxID=218851 RepID=A0A2G5CBX9_AQUCA|nr:hypothetical protein AQUCO_06700056v1 [Aquilegia coerulea]
MQNFVLLLTLEFKLAMILFKLQQLFKYHLFILPFSFTGSVFSSAEAYFSMYRLIYNFVFNLKISSIFMV